MLNHIKPRPPPGTFPMIGSIRGVQLGLIETNHERSNSHVTVMAKTIQRARSKGRVSLNYAEKNTVRIIDPKEIGEKYEVSALRKIGGVKRALIITRRVNIYKSGEKTLDVTDIKTGEAIYDINPKWLTTINQELN